jgi:hypothetical protein
METWELAARERIRDSFARYTHPGDNFPLDDLAASFCEDGILEWDGEQLQGRDTIHRFRVEARERSGGVEPGRILRHNVTNIWFKAVTPQEASVLSCYTVYSEIGLDHFGRYIDRFVPVGDDWLIAHRIVTMDWAAKQSKF